MFYNIVFDMLESIRFPTCKSRKNIGESKAFVLGDVNYRGQKSLGGATRGPSRWNKKFPELYDSLKKWIKKVKPTFKWTTIQVNKNVVSPPHFDKNNVGPSYIIALGDYTGGELVIEGQPFNIKNKWKKFDGRKGHWVKPFKGTRYSLVFFTHTFKPPTYESRFYTVKKTGLYKNGELVKKYKK